MKPKTCILKKTIICYIALSMSSPLLLRAQFEDRLYRTDYNLNPGQTKELRLQVENLSFFHDNEFSGSIVSGYTLPGLWLRPKLSYQPLNNLQLETGLHALVYHGANKYPNYSYRDISTWKGDQYQHGMHLLPYFRVHAQLRRVHLVLGNLYGGSNHGLIEPLYSPELNLTADPEAGFQLLYDIPRFHLDAWINWESFIFRQDTHGETFTVGLSSQVRYNAPDAHVHLYTPIQGILQHRGGEIDAAYPSSVSTLINGATGIGVIWNVKRPILKQVYAEADVLGYYQQNGYAAPLDNGFGIYTQAGIRLGTNWQVRSGYFYGNDFISLFGLPFFGTISTKHVKGLFGRMHTAFFTADYSRQFGRIFSLGVQASLYHSQPGTLTLTDGTQTDEKASTSYTFGIYLRVNLDFLLKKF